MRRTEMKFVNGWNYMFKDLDRVEIKLRVSLLTILDIYIDFSSGGYNFTICNFSVRN